MVELYWCNVLCSKSVPCHISFGRVSRPALERSWSRTVGAQEKSSDKVFATSSSSPYTHTRGGIVHLLPSQAPTICARRRLHSVFSPLLAFPSGGLRETDAGGQRPTEADGRGRKKEGVFPRRLSAHAPGLSLSLSLAFFLSVFRRPPDWVSLSFGRDGGGGGGGGASPQRRQTSDPGTRQKRGANQKRRKEGGGEPFWLCGFFLNGRKSFYT